MTEEAYRDRLLAMAVLYVERFGFSVIPMGEDKTPLIKWQHLQESRPTLAEILSWRRHNLAIITGAISNIVVVDCESREDAAWFWKHRGKTSAVVKTRRGYHLYFRHPGERVANAQKVKDEKGSARYDVRGDGGYVLAPPSRHTEGNYFWVKKLDDPQTLPVFQREWRPEARISEDNDRKIRDAVRYISRIRAVAGQAGHDNTFRAACTLIENGLSEAEALLALQSWNRTNAEPPWSDRELLHKIRSAISGPRV